MEDAYILSGLLKDANSTEELTRAFKAFDEVRRGRTQKLVTTSYEAGQLYDFELLGDDLDKIEENFSKRMHWIWNFDLEAHLEQAREIMKK